MKQIILYNYTGRSDTVNKTLTDGKTLNGNLTNAVSILSPILSITSADKNILNYNYCFIPDLNRYYFIDQITATGGNTYKIYLSVDVLKTYENAILSATGTVVKSDTANKYISNRETVYDRKPKFEKIPFPASPLDETGNIIMVTIKGTGQETIIV